MSVAGKYTLSARFTCRCGQVREIQTGKDARGHTPGAFVMPCCLRRYLFNGWQDGEPTAIYIGREDWSKGRLRVLDDAGKEVPLPERPRRPSRRAPAPVRRARR